MKIGDTLQNLAEFSSIRKQDGRCEAGFIEYWIVFKKMNDGTEQVLSFSYPEDRDRRFAEIQRNYAF